MNAPLIARILGFALLLAGIAGFVPWIAPAAPFGAPVVTLDTAYRMLFWVFPVNVALDVLYLFLGFCGVVAGLRFGAAVVYLRTLVWIYLILVILGAIPLTSVFFGVAPIYGWDVALHAVVALFAAYGGYGRGSIAPEAKAPAK